MTAANIVLDSGGTNELTIYSSRIERNYNKKLTLITPPTATSLAKQAAGPKTTKAIDMLRIEVRFDIDGKINTSDDTKLININNAGGDKVLLYRGVNYDFCLDKFSITEYGKQEDDHFDVKITGIVCKQIGGS